MTTLLSRARSLVDQALAGARQFGDGVERTRRQLAELKDARERLAGAPVPKAVALARLNAWAEGLTARRPTYIGGFVAPDGRGVPDLIPDAPRLLTMIAPLVRDYYAGLLEQHYAAAGDGIADDERAARLADLDVQIADLERVEESLIRSGEAIGIELLRRHDASPEVVLAPDGELPH